MLEERIQPHKSIPKSTTRMLNKIQENGKTLFYYPNMIGICKSSDSPILDFLSYKIVESSSEHTIVELKNLNIKN